MELKDLKIISKIELELIISKIIDAKKILHDVAIYGDIKSSNIKLNEVDVKLNYMLEMFNAKLGAVNK